jgi:hypothetical protein
MSPAYANLYLAFHEIHSIIPEFGRCLKIFKRYIDDGLVLWNPKGCPENNFELNRFLSKINKIIPGIKFTHVKASTSMPFLDLEIFWYGNKLATRSYSKPLHLYLYLPPFSAHPPGMLNSVVSGFIKKFKHQNTLFSDFKTATINLFNRLLQRGYSRHDLLKAFSVALHKYAPTVSLLNCPIRPPKKNQTPDNNTNTSTTQLFFKIQYDPNGPSRKQLRKFINADKIEALASSVLNKPVKLTVCYEGCASLSKCLGSPKLRANCPIDVRNILTSNLPMVPFSKSS